MPDSTPISPAESLLLLNLTYSSRQAMKVTFLALMAQKALRIDGDKYLHVLVPQVPNAPEHVASLLDALNSGKRSGLDIDEVVRLLRNTYGNKGAGFKNDLVLPAMVARGLMVEERFGLFRLGRRLRPTPAGEAERDRIEAAVQKAREIPDLLQTAPVQAAAVALDVGNAILLVDRLTFLYAELGEAMQKHRNAALADLGKLAVTAYAFENMDRHAIGVLDACLQPFDDTPRFGGAFGGGAA